MPSMDFISGFWNAILISQKRNACRSDKMLVGETNIIHSLGGFQKVLKLVDDQYWGNVAEDN